MNGGKRLGAGRKPGVSETTIIKRRIASYFSEEEVKQLVLDIKEQAKTKPELLKFLGEQLFGKAPQTIEADVTHHLPKPILDNVSNNISNQEGSIAQ